VQTLTSTPSKRFLVVEDQPDIADLVAMHLSDLDADVTIQNNGQHALKAALESSWDAIILDLKLPGMDGLDVCREIRSNANYIPILMLTSRDSELDRVLGLEIGADDYLAKPFSIPELKARVKALVRRAQNARPIPAMAKTLDVNGVSLNQDTRQAWLDDRPLELTAKEFDLLWFFASSPGVVFKRSDLLDKVWGYGHEGYEHTVNSHINRLRGKLERRQGERELIQTVWGVGYRFNA